MRESKSAVEFERTLLGLLFAGLLPGVSELKHNLSLMRSCWARLGEQDNAVY